MESQSERLWGTTCFLPMNLKLGPFPRRGAALGLWRSGEKGRKMLLQQDEYSRREFSSNSFNFPGVTRDRHDNNG